VEEAHPEMAFEVRRRRIGSGDRAVEIVDVVGRLDAPGSALLRTSIQQALKEGSARIAVNLSECREIQREVIGTLHSLGRACKRANGGLAIFGAKDDVLEYMKRFGDRELAPWFDTENEAIVSLGGEVIEEPGEDEEQETPVVVAIGSSDPFRRSFWKLNTLGGKPVAKFDNTESAHEFIRRRNVHSVIIDTSLNPHNTARLVRQLRTYPETRQIGIFIVGPPTGRNIGRSLIGEGADNFVPLVFSGEEIAAKLDIRAFFTRLKEAYDRYEAKRASEES
jgi:anti-anti-sigma regulatory factor